MNEWEVTMKTGKKSGGGGTCPSALQPLVHESMLVVCTQIPSFKHH